MRIEIKSDGTSDGTKFYDRDTGEELDICGCTRLVWGVDAALGTSWCHLHFVDIPITTTLPERVETKVLTVDTKYLNEVVDLQEEIRKFNDGQPVKNVTKGQRTADQIAKAFGVDKK